MLGRDLSISPSLTPANSIGGHLSRSVSDQYAYPMAGVHMLNSRELRNIEGRELTRDNLHNLDTERVCVDLAHAVDLMTRGIERL